MASLPSYRAWGQLLAGLGNRKPVGRPAWPPRVCSGPSSVSTWCFEYLALLPFPLGIPPAKSSALGALGESLE